MILLLSIPAVLILSASSYALVGRSVRRMHPDIFEERTDRRAAPRDPEWRSTHRYQ